MANRKGVSVIVSTIILILIVAATSIMVYSAFSQNLVPTPDTNRILEDLRIVKIDVNNSTDVVTLFVLNRGGVDITIDYSIIENVTNQNTIFVNQTNSLDPNRVVPVGASRNITFIANESLLNEPIFNYALIFKVVTTRGVATSMLYSPETSALENTPPYGSPGSGGNNFTITVYKFLDNPDDQTNFGHYVPSDTLLTGFTYYLYDQNHLYLASSTTNSDSVNYLPAVFAGLSKGTYYVDEKDEPHNATSYVSSTPSEVMESITSQNASIYWGDYNTSKNYYISGKVYEDNYANGLAQWTVVAYLQNGNEYYASTNLNGFYTIWGPAGNYTVEAILQYPYINITNAEIDGLFLSDDTQANCTSINFGVTFFGFNGSAPYNISGLVFNDTNRNKVFDPPTEQGLSGWLVMYNDSSGIKYGVTTNSTGYYFIPLFNAGNYTVQELLKKDYKNSTPKINQTYVPPDQIIDFGNYYDPPHIYSISGIAFSDNDSNGMYNSSLDSPLANWPISCIIDGIPFWNYTDSSGNFTFSNLAEGNYTLQIIFDPLHWFNTTQSIQVVQIANGTNVTGVVFGLHQIQYLNITCFAFNDTNNNGVYDPGIDIPLPNLSLDVNATGQYTDINGICTFVNCSSGIYLVQAQSMATFYLYNNTNRIVYVTLTNSSAYLNFSYIYNPLKTIQGYVFNDTDHSGTKTGNESGIPGVIVWLSRPIFGSVSTITDINGFYNFTGISNGTCTVTVNQTSFDSSSLYINSSPNPVTMTINYSNSVVPLDFGFYKKSSTAIYTISGIKFNDSNGDMIYEPGPPYNETSLAGWTILLYNGSYNGTGFPNSTAITTTAGYLFSNLTNGTWTVIELPQTGWVHSLPVSNVVTIAGSSLVVNFGNYYVGVGNNTYIYSIKGMVFNDSDNSGNFTAGDKGYSGASVVLKDSSGLPIFINTTNSNGNYTFDNLPNGTFTVYFTPPVGYTSTTSPSINVTIAGASVGGNDFGIHKSNATAIYSIGGYVFNDSNKNGLFDGTEVGLVGWTVMLFNGTYNGTGAPYANAITDSAGSYLFSGIVNGNYTVIELLNSGYINTTARISFITINNSSQGNVNFGNYPTSKSTYAISGYIFLDVDHNGVFNASDTGYGTSAVLIQLLDNTTLPIAYTYQINGGAAGNTGFYNFTSLSPGTYTVYIQVPSGYTNSTPSRVMTTITITNVTINFGIYSSSANATYYISGWKWNDTNANGVWDTGEKGMGTWSIWLYVGDYTGGVPVGVFPYLTTTTNGTLAGAAGSGFYMFSGLANNTYTVIETWVNGYTNTTAIAKSVIIAGSGFTNINFSNARVPLQNYTVNGRVYNDTDNSSSWTQGDTGYASMSYVYINSPLGFPMTRLTTLASPAGNYTFSGLGNGTNYRVYISVPSGYTNTTPSSVYVTIAGQNITSIDFGVHKIIAPPTYSIGGFKFNDTNGDGIYNSTTDALLSGWTIMLYNGTYSGTQFPITPIQTTAAGTGAYLYSYLVPGTYTVLELPQTNWTCSNATRYAIVTITNASLQVIFGNSKIGVVPTYTVSGLVFNDSDHNGVMTAGEVYSGTLNVYADDALGIPYTYVTSNATGYFTLSGLPNGVYTIYPQIPSGWTNSTSARVTVTISGSNVTGINFGIYKTGVNATYTIFGSKFNDTNSNGIFDGTDSKITNWPINFYNYTYSGIGFPNSTVFTDSSGNYQFSGLRNGTYTIVESLQPGWTNTTNREVIVTISGSSVNVTFGNHKQVAPPPFTVSGIVFNDTDNDSVYAGSDTGYSGAVVWLNDGSGTPIGSTTTDANGNYNFSYLANGNYKVYIVVPTGYSNTTATQIYFTISGANVTNQNFGIHMTAAPIRWSIYGYKINATSGTGISGWTIQLYNGNYTGVEVPIGTSTTDSNGYFVFGGLSSGWYTVIESQQSGWVNSTPRIRFLNVASTTQANFSNYQIIPHSISGLVFNDINSDGTYNNPPDLPLQGWTVRLLDNLGSLQNTTLTNAGGNYAFSNLYGNYTVELVIQNGWQNTTNRQVPISVSNADRTVNFGVNVSLYSISGFVRNDTANNGTGLSGWTVILTNSMSQPQYTTTNSTGYFYYGSVAPDNYTVEVALQIGWTNTTPRILPIDVTNSPITGIIFGVNVTSVVGDVYSIGGMVFNDVDANGVYNATVDSVLSNWTVLLTNSLNQVYSNVTDSSGQYVFSGLSSGTYLLQEILPSMDWVNTTSRLQNVTITTSSNFSVNFGDYYTKYNISGYVFFDVDKNGVYNAGDIPLSGWTLNLTNTLTVKTNYTTSDSSGFYQFTNYPGSIYLLSELTPQGWTTSPTSISLNVNASTPNQNFSNVRAFFPGLFKTFSQTDWSTDTDKYLTNNFTTIYPSGFVEIGLPGSPGNYSIQWWGNQTLMHDYIGNNAANAILTQDYVNPPQYTYPGGNFGANVLALRFNIDWSNKGSPFNPQFGSLKLYNYTVTYGGSLNGQTISQILNLANKVLNGTDITTLVSPGYTLANLNGLLNSINNAFSTSDLSWASTHLY